MGDDVIEQGRQCGTSSGTRSSLRREDCGIMKPAVWRRLSLAVIRSSDRLSLRQSLLNVNLDDILHIAHLSSVLCRIYAVALPHLYYVLLCRSPTARAVVSAETDVHDIHTTFLVYRYIVQSSCVAKSNQTDGTASSDGGFNTSFNISKPSPSRTGGSGPDKAPLPSPGFA